MKNSKLCFVFIVLFLFSTISPNIQIGVQQTNASTPSNMDTFSLFILADYAFFQLYGIDSVNIIYSLVQTMNSYYQQSGLNMQFYVAKIVVDLTNESFVAPSFSNGQIVASDYLINFDTWEKTNSSVSGYDIGQLVSGYEFQGGTVGLGYVGSVGTIHHNSVIQANFVNNNAYMASIMAHEIGHNFNAEHDGTGNSISCPSGTYIMSASSTPSNPLTIFSSCSISEITSYINTLSKNYVDIEIPIITHPVDISTSFGSNTPVLISWVINDTNPYEYTITQDGVPSSLYYWYENGTITYEFIKTVPGTFNVVINVTDGAGNSILDTVQVTMESIPILTHSQDIAMNTSESNIIWFNVTYGVNGTFSLFKNGSVVDSGSWNQNLNYSVSLTNLTLGLYNFTFEVLSPSYSPITATVNVNVTTISSLTSETTSTPVSSNTNSTPTNSDNLSPNNSTPSGFLPFSFSFMLFIIIPFIRNRRK